MRPSFTIAGHGLTATFTDLGAVLHDLRLDGHAPPLVLGLADLDHYPQHSNYMGATAGRYANRIANGRFQIDGTAHQADTNFRDRHLLHGGADGTGRQVWDMVEQGDDHIRFAIDLADGHMGFPGAMRVEATYRCDPGACLRVDYTATTDAPTLCNFAHHSYWTLDGQPTVADHVLSVDADRYTPVNDDLIPTGVEPVEGTAYDFRAGRGLAQPGLLDHNLCLSDGRVPLREVGRLWSTVSGVEMRIATTEPGLQVYDGAGLNTQVPGLEGRVYRAHAGVALEPQIWPDAPNHDDFPDAVLRPGETYHQTTTFTFSKG
ncbi:aldose epimerase family protein [Jannaschia sp. M317]|uniref:aldose epimerase family protein n=1 Tax=Jannaschia sp. M317 TaxID=2867011 RepID=UPI0021A7599A|nr:aldose epimerase family protein [Jannaschia sp. M317]UWQ18808.1 galactose mutarotase [Jannaschia sp. M317]